MKKGIITILILSILLVANFIFKILNIYSYILFLLIVTIIIYIIYGFQRNNSYYKKSIFLIVGISSIFYISLTYLLGKFVNYVKSGYNLTLISIAKNVIPLFVIICLEEIIRYIFVTRYKKNKFLLFLIIILCILMNSTLMANNIDFSNKIELTKFIFIYIFPFIAQNILLTYLTYKVGLYPNILYRTIFEISIYILPFFPNTGIYLDTILKIVFPFVLFNYVYLYTRENIKKNLIKHKNKITNKIFSSFVIILLLIMILLNSGIFNYYSITIGSGSMLPDIKVGDIVFVKKINEEQISKLNVGEILVFKYNGKIIVHRIIEVKKNLDGYVFYTKGDANNAPDEFATKPKNIIGIYKNKISYIGYPTVLLNQFLEND